MNPGDRVKVYTTHGFPTFLSFLGSYYGELVHESINLPDYWWVRCTNLNHRLHLVPEGDINA